MEIIIRRWEERDYPSVLNLFLQVHELHQANRPDFYAVSCEPLKKDEFAKLSSDEFSVGFVAEADGEVIAFSLMTIREPSGNPLLIPRRIAFVEDICVDGKYRRRGVGKKLFLSLKKKAEEKHCQSLELMVWDFNQSAVEFYKNLGMKSRSIILETRI